MQQVMSDVYASRPLCEHRFLDADSVPAVTCKQQLVQSQLHVLVLTCVTESSILLDLQLSNTLLSQLALTLQLKDAC